MIHCFKCGADLPDNMIYCLHCGNRLDEETETVLREPIIRARSADKVPDEVFRTLAAEPAKKKPTLRFWATAGGIATIIMMLTGVAAIVVVLVGIVISNNTGRARINTTATANANRSRATESKTPRPLPARTPHPRAGKEPGCYLSNNGKPVQARWNCRLNNCTEDPSTMIPELLPDGTDVTIGPDQIPSGKGYFWIPIAWAGEFNVYVASTKIRCDD